MGKATAILSMFLILVCTDIVSGQNTTETKAPAAPPAASEDAPAMQDIHDIKPPIPAAFPWSRLWPAVILIALAAVAVASVLLWRRRNRKLRAARTETVSPEDQAIAALNVIEGEMPLAARIFYFRLTGVLRYYLSRRFEIPAVEMTVEELLPRIDALDLERDVKQSLKTLFRDAEPIKFAGAEESADKQSRDLSFASAFVAEWRPRAPESAEEAA